MLVYANHLSLLGVDAEDAIFKAIGGWLKEQLGIGLHPDQLRRDGDFNGYRGNARSWLRVYATNEEEPELYAWVLRSADESVHGRHWITELGLKIFQGSLELTCIVKTDEQSTLVANPVSASRPRVIRYVVNNIQQASDAGFAASVSGLTVKSVGHDRDSYRGLLAEIERQERDCPIVLVSPTRDGEFPINATHLQQDLVGLAQVVEVFREFDSYEMEDILGKHWSVWGGAVNILHIPTHTGFVRRRFFLPDEIESWGETQHERISQLLAWVTNNTNVLRQRRRIRPEGVMQLALRRRLQAVRAKSDQMNSSQLRGELEEASRLATDQAEWINTLEDDNSTLTSELLELKTKLGELEEDLKSKRFEVQSLKDHLASAGGGRASNLDAESLLNLVRRNSPPNPLECLGIIETMHGDKCVILDSAKTSAHDMNRFVYGRQLLDMLIRLVTEYRTKMINGGDIQARKVFGKNEYAAKESETVMNSKVMQRLRTFEYQGEQVAMFRHLKIGVDDDTSKTIRVHFHWDASREKLVIGYCGKHLPVASH